MSKWRSVWWSQAGGGGGLTAIVDDAAPQLGGDLDTLGNDIFNSVIGQILIRGYSLGASGGSIYLRAGNGTAGGSNVSFSPGRDTTDESNNGFVQLLPQDFDGPAPELRWKDKRQVRYVGFRAADDISIASTGDGTNGVWILPEGEGQAGEAMITNGSRVLSWSPIAADLGEFTVAGLPSAATNPNAYALATNAVGGRTIVRSDGTNWKIVAVEGATVT